MEAYRSYRLYLWYRPNGTACLMRCTCVCTWCVLQLFRAPRGRIQPCTYVYVCFL